MSNRLGVIGKHIHIHTNTMMVLWPDRQIHISTVFVTGPDVLTSAVRQVQNKLRTFNQQNLVSALHGAI